MAKEKRQYPIEMKIYRVLTEVHRIEGFGKGGWESGDLEPISNKQSYSTSPYPSKTIVGKTRTGLFPLEPLELLTYGTGKLQLEVGGVHMTVDGPDLRWDGRDEPAHPDIVLIGAPRILLEANQSGRIEMRDETPIQYFEKADDGRFDLKTLDKTLGMRIGIQIHPREESDEEGTVRTRLWLSRAVIERERIEGVSLDVGKPSIRQPIWTNLLLQSKLQEWTGFIMTVGVEEREQGYIFLFWKVFAIDKPG